MNNNLSASHGSNVTSMQLLISIISGWGTTYNPTPDTIKLPALKALYTSGGDAIKAVDDLMPDYLKVKNERDVLFDPLNTLTTRVMNAFISIVKNSAAQANVRSLVNLVQTGRVNPKKKKATVADPAAEPQTDNSNESHKSGFSVRIENFYKLIQLLASFPAYAPNEPELTVASLGTLYDSMVTKNQAVIDHEIPLKKARDTRNTILYDPTTGLVEAGQDAKSYIKSVFGAQSTQQKQVSKIKFAVYNH
jgi:hypothetical protein